VLDKSGVDVVCLTVVMERRRTTPQGDCSLLYILLEIRQTRGAPRPEIHCAVVTSCAWAGALRLYDKIAISLN
jgi:hypothetical protein